MTEQARPRPYDRFTDDYGSWVEITKSDTERLGGPWVWVSAEDWRRDNRIALHLGRSQVKRLRRALGIWLAEEAGELARWTIVRVANEDGQLAAETLVAAFAPITMRVHMNIEEWRAWEIAVQGRTEAEIRSVLGETMILDLRTQLDAEQAPGTWRTEET